MRCQEEFSKMINETIKSSKPLSINIDGACTIVDVCLVENDMCEG